MSELIDEKIKEKLEIIKAYTYEIINEDELIELLKTKKQPSVYLGTAITGRPHIGYFTWVLKLGDFLKAGFKVKVLLADLHGALDNTPWDLLEHRYKYYSIVIKAMFESVGIDTSNLEIIRGSSFQLSKEYSFDILRMSSYASVHDCKKASSEVVKQSDNPKLSGLIYPIMQALDEQYLDVDIQLGGTDQRKILMFAREYLPKLGYKRRIEIMLPLIPGLIGEKMSSSNKDSKIDLIDSYDDIKRKLKKAYCPEGIVEGNGILAFMKYVVFRIINKFEIKRPEKFGGDVIYNNYEELEKDFINKRLHPFDLKMSLVDVIDKLLEPIRNKVDPNLIKKAYPND